LTLALRQAEFFFKYGNQDIVAGCHKSPKEKHGDQRNERTPARLKLFRTHKIVISLANIPEILYRNFYRRGNLLTSYSPSVGHFHLRSRPDSVGIERFDLKIIAVAAVHSVKVIFVFAV